MLFLKHDFHPVRQICYFKIRPASLHAKDLASIFFISLRSGNNAKSVVCVKFENVEGQIGFYLRDLGRPRNKQTNW